MNDTIAVFEERGIMEVANKDINNQFSINEKEKNAVKTKTENGRKGGLEFRQCYSSNLSIRKVQSDFMVVFSLSNGVFGMRFN